MAKRNTGFRGELYTLKPSGKTDDFVGAIFKVDGGYVVRNGDNYGTTLFNGRVFTGMDFAVAGQLNLGYGIVKKYSLR